MPVKRLSEAKSSLSHVLGEEERRELVLSMLADVLKVIKATTSLAGVVVVSPDEEVLRAARISGALGLLEPSVGLNKAIELAIQRAAAEGADAVLVLPADLPLVRVADLENIIAMARSPREVVLAPSKDNGTNALLLKPPDAISLRFGGESFVDHLWEARGRGILPRIYRSTSIAMDVDNIQDLMNLEVEELGAHTRAVVQKIKRGTKLTRK
ncbi:MAG: 2-phospho-L-lactate guanylyltransferase [Candidatus Hadarchaeales archaeon]